MFRGARAALHRAPLAAGRKGRLLGSSPHAPFSAIHSPVSFAAADDDDDDSDGTSSGAAVAAFRVGTTALSSPGLSLHAGPLLYTPPPTLPPTPVSLAARVPPGPLSSLVLARQATRQATSQARPSLGLVGLRSSTTGYSAYARAFSSSSSDPGSSPPRKSDGRRRREDSNEEDRQSDSDALEEQAEEPKGIRRLLVPVLAGGAFLMGKAKYVLVALKLAKFMPLASMVLTSTERERERERERE